MDEELQELKKEIREKLKLDFVAPVQSIPGEQDMAYTADFPATRFSASTAAATNPDDQ